MHVNVHEVVLQVGASILGYAKRHSHLAPQVSESID